jgi:lipoate-protein ligase B
MAHRKLVGGRVQTTARDGMSTTATPRSKTSRHEADTSARFVSILHLGVHPYESALRLQHQIVAARQEGRIGDILILLQHPPVITLGRHADESNILVSREWLAEHDILVHRVERGGDVTYHGPGQLVGYPIMDLRQYRQDVGWYMHSLEEMLIRTLDDFGIEAGRSPGNIGVWLDERRKIAALGARIEKWITYHGFALNAAADRAHFELIVPCGLADKGVTSMEEALGRPIDLGELRERLVESFAEVFGVQVAEVTHADLLHALDHE